MAISKIKTGSITDSAITTAKISDGTIVNADISPSAAIVASKTVICTAVTDQNAFNISLLGFKMAVNEGLTVFNLVDGIVDEFHDESGTDESEGSNDTYSSVGDHYQNAPILSGCISSGFTTTTTTEADTSTAGTNPAGGAGTLGAFTVPTGMTSVGIKVWGAGGSSSWDNPGYGDYNNTGGGGGFTTGTLAVTGGQVLRVSAGEGGYGVVHPSPTPCDQGKGLFGAGPGASGGAGIAGVFTTNSITPTDHSAPGVYMVAGGGGGSGGFASGIDGGVGGGTTGGAGGGDGTTAQTNNKVVNL